MAYKTISPQPIVEGGTGVQSNTAYAVLCGGTTSTSAIQSIATVGSSGQVLTSNGAGALPTFQTTAASAITSITGTTGGAQSGPAITFAGGTTGLSFNGSSNTITTTFAGITANGGVVALSTDAVTGDVYIGTGAAFKTIVIGSTSSISQLTLQSGTTGIAMTANNGAIDINAGTGPIGLATNATASTITIGTGTASKTIIIGSVTGASPLTLRSGTGNFSVTSGTGTTISALNTGEVTMPRQPAFFAYLANTIPDATGDGTFYTIIFDTEVYDQGADFNLATSTFVAPVTGRYHFACGVGYTDLGALFTDGRILIITSNRTFQIQRSNYGAIQTSGILIAGNNVYADMDAGDAATINTYVGVSTKTVDIFGDTNALTFFSGVLVV